MYICTVSNHLNPNLITLGKNAGNPFTRNCDDSRDNKIYPRTFIHSAGIINI